MNTLELLNFGSCKLKKKEISTTFELVELIKKVNSFKKKHPATRVFRALRIFINDELNELDITLKKSLLFLKKNGKNWEGRLFFEGEIGPCGSYVFLLGIPISRYFNSAPPGAESLFEWSLRRGRMLKPYDIFSKIKHSERAAPPSCWWYIRFLIPAQPRSSC